MSLLVDLRKELHRNAELSGQEKQTSLIIRAFLEKFTPQQIITFPPSHGIAAIYCGSLPGKTIVVRAELDALPIMETLDIAHGSLRPEISHKCGHDGHMTMVAGLAPLLAENPLPCGKVILLFQPAEETGEGAREIIDHANFKSLKVDYAFALHNMPGYPLGKVLMRKDVFCCTSKGMIIELQGKSSHAAEPHNSITPTTAVMEIISQCQEVAKSHSKSLVTIVHVCIGEPAFGICPGDAVIMMTLRSESKSEMESLSTAYVNFAQQVASTHQLELSIKWQDDFPITKNNGEAVEEIQKAVNDLQLNHQYLQRPISWSEDFGHFAECCHAAMFGLGSGEHQPPLHHPHYDFPDALITTGTNIFKKIIDQLLTQRK